MQKLIAATKPTKLVYKILIRKNSTRPQKSEEKWVKDCGLEVVEDLSWRSIYLLPRLCTISTRIRNFQFKFLHRRIATNTFLFKVGISDTALCYLCKTDKETLIHLFWECSVMKTFWERVQGFFVSIYLIPASHVLDIYECLGFKGEKDDILVSHCLLLARYYIYCCKFKNISPSIREYAQQLKYNLETENKYLPLLIPKINSRRNGTKYFMHYNCYIVCGQVSKCKPARRLYTLQVSLS